MTSSPRPANPFNPVLQQFTFWDVTTIYYRENVEGFATLPVETLKYLAGKFEEALSEAQAAAYNNGYADGVLDGHE